MIRLKNALLKSNYLITQEHKKLIRCEKEGWNISISKFGKQYEVWVMKIYTKDAIRINELKVNTLVEVICYLENLGAL